MKRILGLDLGTNSIGWALVEQDFDNMSSKIVKAGTRIIPMSQDVLGKFDSGVSDSQTAARTTFRGVRRLRQRHFLRRERLHRVLNILGFLPKHYALEIDFEKKLGQFKENTEPKIAYRNTGTIENLNFEFIFQSSFNEMLLDFKQTQPQLFYLKANGEETKIPYDWTIYYLRKKALTQQIEKEELAWLLLNFNQKRGYFQLRGELEEENPNKLVEFHSLVVVKVEEDKEKAGKTKDEKWYNVILENDWIYKRSSKTPLDWEGKTKDFIVTTELNDDGSFKKRTFRSPDEKDWTLIKKKTEDSIIKSQKTVGTYIYDTLLASPEQKINGKLVTVIERKFYKAELLQILKTQKQFHVALQDKTVYDLCVNELYENNETHRNSIDSKDFVHLFLNDIIFYQRPLKSKKSLISDCQFESRTYLNKKTGVKVTEPLKCIAKSHPLFQEFRLWQWLQNLRIYEKDSEKEVTTQFLSTQEHWIDLFYWLNDRKEVDHKALLTYILKPFKLKINNYRWNYVYDAVKDESKSYPCNKTRNLILNKLDKNKCKTFLSQENEIRIWEFLYSIRNKEEAENALKPKAERDAKKKNPNQFSLANLLLNNGFEQDEINSLVAIKLDEKDYGSYSAKAIKKLMALMKTGSLWQEEAIHIQTRDRIEKLLTGEFDEKIRKRVREKALNLNHISDFQGLPLWLASYVVYDRHAEDGETLHWRTPADIEHYLRFTFKQHAYRNPIVEQVITETLRVVKDIWATCGEGKETFFDEIHVELGRELKNPADKRKQITTQNSDNENTNLRIKALLIELASDTNYENVRPYSPNQQEILKIYEEGALNSDDEIPEDILKIAKQAQPSVKDLTKYKLWLDQKYRSPYTGEIIPLSTLFTDAYEVEHIIPKSRYFDDSMSNKVICEEAVNKLKTNDLAYPFILNNAGRIIELGFGKTATIFTIDQYETFVKENFATNRTKAKKLLLEEIPEAFVQRQLNDTRYISKVIKGLLSNIVREENEQEAISKNVITVNGSMTSVLKQDWGLNDVWNTLITPRFERLNHLTNSTNFGEWTNKEGKRVFQTEVPLQLQKGFTKKRIDHRHHALDAIVIALSTRNHVNYLNNESALGKDKAAIKEKRRHDLRNILCDKKYNAGTTGNYNWVFKKPYQTLTQDVQSTLEGIVISFKQNIRVINKTKNSYYSYKDKSGKLNLDQNGNAIKTRIPQKTSDRHWAIRKPLHVPMPYGKKIYDFDLLKIDENIGKRDLIVDLALKEKLNQLVLSLNNNIGEVKKCLKDNPLKDNQGAIILTTLFKVKNEKFRKRQSIFELSKRGLGGIKTSDDAVKFISKIADVGIRKDLFTHLKNSANDIDIAFNTDGLEKFNSTRNIPVYKLAIIENGEKRFPLGKKSFNNHKWVEAEKGTNLFFAIYQDLEGKRNYETIGLHTVIERQKEGLSPVPEVNKHGHKLLMYLSPNDLVYVPSDDENENLSLLDFTNLTKEQIKRIWNVNDFSTAIYFTPNSLAQSIAPKEVDLNFDQKKNKLTGSFDTKTASFEDQQIKDCCIKLKVDRLGNVQRHR